jgi:hypothetical protein
MNIKLISNSQSQKDTCAAVYRIDQVLDNLRAIKEVTAIVVTKVHKHE